MELEWDSDFETGNEYADLQHRYEDQEFLKENDKAHHI